MMKSKEINHNALDFTRFYKSVLEITLNLIQFEISCRTQFLRFLHLYLCYETAGSQYLAVICK